MAFPKKLDNANVILYTDNDDFGVLACADGSNPIPIRYLAICQYPNDKLYYLFLCNEQIEVETDDLCDTIDEAKKWAYQRNKNIRWHSI
jgi:hypothetical protein